MPQRVHQVLERRPARLLADPERDGYGLSDQGRVGQARQFDQPNSVGVAVNPLSRYLQGQAGLADATGSDERQQARGVKPPSHLVQLLVTPDETAQLGGQIVATVGPATGRLWRRTLLLKSLERTRDALRS